MVEKNLGMESIFWDEDYIFAFMLVLEKDTKSGKKIVINSMERKFGLVKTIFESKGHPIPIDTERRVRVALNDHYKIRLDKAENPTKDGTAPMLSPEQWVKIQKWLEEESNSSTYNFRNKNHMAMLAISFGFPTGLRLSEIHRLKYSDLDLDGEEEIRLRIRRSKSNRRGHKKVWQVAPAFGMEPWLCPVQNLMKYVDNMKKFMAPGAYIFADDEEGRKLTNIENIVRYWRKGAKAIGLPRSKWPGAHSFHNQKINIARALGYSDVEITDAMNWQSTSVLHQYLRRVNESRGGIAYKLTSLSAEDLTRLTSHLWA